MPVEYLKVVSTSIGVGGVARKASGGEEMSSRMCIMVPHEAVHCGNFCLKVAIRVGRSSGIVSRRARTSCEFMRRAVLVVLMRFSD